MVNFSDLRIKIFADGASAVQMAALDEDPLIKGFTTNPSLMRAAGVKNYRGFAASVLRCTRKPVSFEVFADDPDGMLHQAHAISKLGPNVWVKIPVTNTLGQFTGEVIKTLSTAGVQINITAVFTLEQVQRIKEVLDPASSDHIVSIFAGRIADTGLDPRPIVTSAKACLADQAAVLWASCREVYNIIEADHAGADIITVTPEIIAKLPLLGKDLEEYSLETVRQFRRDAEGLSL